ncbi:MAG: bifunctional pyr operon transcriptional regulator/uracil phosphoribosyltransferase PyrR [Pseudomonadota bacterium]
MPTEAENIDVIQSLESMAGDIERRLEEFQRSDPALIGIRTGGVWLADHLHQSMALKEPLGELNISFYRDDFSQIGMHPTVEPSQLPFDIDGRHLILVDDILYTGRTIRAAMNEIFDYGRPQSVLLAVLVDRRCHELPIRPDVAACTLSLEAGEHVKLLGPDDLRLEICEQTNK